MRLLYLSIFYLISILDLLSQEFRVDLIEKHKTSSIDYPKNIIRQIHQNQKKIIRNSDFNIKDERLLFNLGLTLSDKAGRIRNYLNTNYPLTKFEIPSDRLFLNEVNAIYQEYLVSNSIYEGSRYYLYPVYSNNYKASTKSCNNLLTEWLIEINLYDDKNIDFMCEILSIFISGSESFKDSVWYISLGEHSMDSMLLLMKSNEDVQRYFDEVLNYSFLNSNRVPNRELVANLHNITSWVSLNILMEHREFAVCHEFSHAILKHQLSNIQNEFQADSFALILALGTSDRGRIDPLSAILPLIWLKLKYQILEAKGISIESNTHPHPELRIVNILNILKRLNMDCSLANYVEEVFSHLWYNSLYNIE